MLWSTQLGIGCPPCDVLTAFVLNLHGNALTLSSDLRPADVEHPAAFQALARARDGERRLTFGVVSLFSSHHLFLRDWLAAGVQGLAPYWFDVEATLYLGTAGRRAARLRASYDLRFTQRLILQPELEANLYGRRDPARGLGPGLTDVQFGLRLRYEVHREFAPYVGVRFVQRLGHTADLARAAGRPAFDRQFVAGLRFWF